MESSAYTETGTKIERSMILKKFDPIIYPFKLWVALEVGELKELKNIFYQTFYEDVELNTDLKLVSSCLTYKVNNKEEREIGALVVFTSNEYITIKNIAHESTHAARYFWEHINEDISGEEADAYLVGWIADCIDKTKESLNGE